MRSQLWFEMDDVKTSTYGGGEWTPLWVEDSRDLLRNESSAVRHQNEVSLNECNQRFDKFLKNSEDNLNAHEAKLTELIGKATI